MADEQRGEVRNEYSLIKIPSIAWIDLGVGMLMVGWAACWVIDAYQKPLKATVAAQIDQLDKRVGELERRSR